MTIAPPADVQQMMEQLAIHLNEMQRVFMIQLDWPRSEIKIVANSVIDVQMRAPCCKKEPETAQWLEEECRVGEVLYDVGANVAAYSLIAASLGCEVYAFEPVAVNYLAANRNVLINGMTDKVTVLPFALADGRGLLRFRSEAESTSGTNARRDAVGQTAPVMTMDSAQAAFALAAPTLLKCDVEGMERAVLAGASVSLGGVRSALIECSDESEGEVVECLKAVGLHLTGRHPRLASGISNLRFSRRD